VEGFGFEMRTVAGNEKPVTDFFVEEGDETEGREFLAEFGVGGIDGVGKNEPEAVVLGRFLVVAEHADEQVAEVDGESGEHSAHLGI
jgi:hypothetical protein